MRLTRSGSRTGLRDLTPNPSGEGCDRRAFLERSLVVLGGLVLAPAGLKARWAHAEAAKGSPAADLAAALGESPYVYVSPLRRDGAESTCHGEVWFAWIDGAVVTTVASVRWKARALARGLDRARLWVGDHGRWKGVLGRNEAFRGAPHFDARASVSRDPDLLEALLSEYERKYPAEIGSWGDKMRAGQRDGSRVMIRYQPLPTATNR
ncbi:MAG: hypothetical protein VCC68_01955 [Myxococcota bacterium]